MTGASKQARRLERAKAMHGDKCAYCGGVPDSVDHYIPKALGGPSTAENLLPCCRSCNQLKADLDTRLATRSQVANYLRQLKRARLTVPQAQNIGNRISVDEERRRARTTSKYSRKLLEERLAAHKKAKAASKTRNGLTLPPTSMKINGSK